MKTRDATGFYQNNEIRKINATMKQSDFLKMVFPFKNKVFRFAKRLLASTEEAEDATQELYFETMEKQRKNCPTTKTLRPLQ